MPIRVENDLSKYEPYIEAGLIRKVTSPCGKLVLFNYTDSCTFKRAWDDITTSSRGLILEKDTGRLVGLCLPKFFNLGEHETTRYENLPKEPYTIMDKVDGSMGLLFHYGDKWNVATRGSFTSKQAIKGAEMLSKYDMSQVPECVTLITEIIYPENKIVADYGDREELIILAGFYRSIRHEIDRQNLEIIAKNTGMKLVDKFDMTIEEAISAQKTLPKGIEGFVVRYESGLRLKIKGEEYLKIAKILSNLSPLAFWEAMEDGVVPVKYLEQIPEEFRQEWGHIVKSLEMAYLSTEAEIFLDTTLLPSLTDRRQVGIFIKENPDKIKHPGAIFPYLNSLSGERAALNKYIMKHIRPDGNEL